MKTEQILKAVLLGKIFTIVCTGLIPYLFISNVFIETPVHIYRDTPADECDLHVTYQSIRFIFKTTLLIVYYILRSVLFKIPLQTRTFPRSHHISFSQHPQLTH